MFARDHAGFEKLPPALSLGVTFGILLAGVVYSLWKTRGEPTNLVAKEKLN